MSPGSYGDYGTPDTELWLPVGIALRKMKNGEFYRIGLFSWNKSSLNAFAKVKAQAIRIIQSNTNISVSSLDIVR